MSDAIDQYRVLRDRVDRAAGRLVDMHCKHLACRPGCHDCCTDLTVSAVEYAAILNDLRQAGVTADALPFDAAAACAFLKDGLCMLYRLRPLICRTHGLPIAFLNDGDDAPDGPEMSVSFCPKNFTAAVPEDLAFGPESTLDLDELNADLAAISLRFVDEVGVGAAPVPKRIPLRQLRADLGRQEGPDGSTGLAGG